MSVIGDEYVFRFELPVNDALFVQKLNCNNNFSQHVSYRSFWKEEVLFLGVEVEVASRQILHHDVDVFFVLEDLSDVGEKGMLADGRYQLGL